MNLYGIREYVTESGGPLSYRREHWFVAETEDDAKEFFKNTDYARECWRFEVREIEHGTNQPGPGYRSTFGN